MKHLLIFLSSSITFIASAQNVGIGTANPTEKLHVVGDRSLFENNFVGIGAGNPVSSFTSFQINKNVNNFAGMYINSGVTGIPFYGYALNGAAKSYTAFNSANNQFEYHQTSDATADFFIQGNTKAVFNTGFVGIGTSTPTTGFTGFAMKSAANTFYGSYIDAGVTGTPFYGYALNGTAKGYTAFNGAANQFEYHQTSDATPDFLVQGNTKAVFNTGFVGIGTSTPTTSFTGFAMKSSANTFYGAYVDAGVTGTPFFGYALNGTPRGYTAFNGTDNQYEYHQTSDAIPDFLIQGNTKAVFNTGFVGIGTSTPTTGFTGFAMKSTANTFYGSYIDAGATGTPFYGYALNGSAKAYTAYNSTNNQFEYHQSSDAIPDFAVSPTAASFPNSGFLGIGTSTPTNSFTGLTLKKNVNAFFGTYIDAGATGNPFYGYALNGVPKAFSQVNGSSGNWELVTNITAISVTPSGNVGLGLASPTQKLDVAGTIHASNLNGGATTLSTDASGNIIRTPSDATLKNNVTNINDALDKVLQMHGVLYNFIDEERFGSNRQMGFLAQELEKVVPEAVSSGGDYKSVNYQVLTALLAEAVKEQQKQLNSEKQENLQLREQLIQLVKRMEALEAAKK